MQEGYGTDFASVSNQSPLERIHLMRRPLQIPPHGRCRTLDAGIPRIEPLIAKWKAGTNPPDAKEICRRLVDLCVVSVLLDAGAGNSWVYREQETGVALGRSEGLAIASLRAFEKGAF